MKHKKRVWYVECLNEPSYNFITKNIESCTDETALIETVVDVSLGDEKNNVFVPKRLIIIPEYGVTMLRISKKKFGLRYNIFMKESSGAKITPWNFD